jgi:ABC-type oligopeptide transport system substrate-binding subunit/class 3 adenylate cyclase
VARLETAIAGLEAQRTILGDEIVETALIPLRQQLAELCGTSGRSSLSALAGERRLVTVMFADVSGFTALAETMDPEVARDLMNGCFERLVPVVEKYGGTVDKFIGDEIMALFGAPVAHENDPERALRAALDMVEALAAFNAERSVDLNLHFGINTGLVVAGGIGTRERQQYSVMGDAVNVASRLEDVSERGEILVGPDTYRLTAPLFEFERLGPVQVKGKAEPVPVFRLLASRGVPGRVRGIAGLESPMVGREVEFAALQEAVERLQAGVGGIVTIVGEAGLGKSRLVAELRSRVLGTPLQPGIDVSSDFPPRTPDLARRTWDSGRRTLNWLEGRCLSYGTSIAYLLWLDVLRGLLEVTVEEEPDAVRDVLRERVDVLCPERFAEVYPYLGWLMSLPLDAHDEPGMRDLGGEELKVATFRAIEILLDCAARRCPLVIVCEDLHWADPTSIELLEQLLSLAERAPVLFLCVSRPERERGCWHIKEIAALRYSHRHTDLGLDPLSPVASEALLGNLLRVEGLPQRLKDRIFSHAEGNPFYAEEIVRSLMDSGAVAQDETSGRWHATRDVEDIAIPDTLQGVLMARVDRLQEEAKRVLQLAAVVGRIFLHRVLEDIAREEHELDRRLLTLQQEQMIRERAQVPELEYIFKHHLTQDAAYNSLLKKERRATHRLVAQALERLFPDRVEEQVGLLAHHWERAGEPEKATEYLLRAGDRARLAYANQEAIDYYRRALAFLREGEEYERAARTLIKLGLTYHAAFEFRKAREVYEEGFALWRRVGEPLHVDLPPAPHALRVSCDPPVTLDPTMAWDTASGDLIEQLFSGLVELSAQVEVLPGVAQSWELSEAGRKYVFRLRDDACWSDGVPVTAGDFVYAWRRVLDPDTGSVNATLLYDVRGARAYHQGEGRAEDVGVWAPDESILVVELERPAGYFLHLLAHSATYPLPRHTVEAHGEAWTDVGNIVTNGPFRLGSWDQAESMILFCNPAYRGRVMGNVQRVEISLLPREKQPARLKTYEADGLDILDMTFFPSAEMESARQRHAGEYISVPELATFYIGFDVARPPFDAPPVRQAFVLAADRETLVDVIGEGWAFPATGGFVPPGMPGHSAGIGLPFHPQQARELLADAGYPDGRGFPTVDAWVPSGPLSSLAAEYLQAQWSENLGVEIVWQAVEEEMYVDALRRGTPHLWLTGWAADFFDPDNFLRVGLPWQRTGWRDEAYDKLVEKAGRVMDQGERVRLYQEADRILVHDAAIMPLSYSRLHLLVKPWVGNPPASATAVRLWKDIIIEPH